MAEKVTKRQQAVLDCIEECIREKGYGPTVREVCQSLGLSSPSTVHVHLKALEEKGLIKRDPLKSRSIALTYQLEDAALATNVVQPSFSNIVNVPLVGNVAAGSPILAEENITDTLSLPTEIVGDAPSFLLSVRGESMIEAGINDGDYVVVKEQPVANNGDIVVAIIDDGATVKRFFKESDHIRLQPRTPRWIPSSPPTAPSPARWSRSSAACSGEPHAGRQLDRTAKPCRNPTASAGLFRLFRTCRCAGSRFRRRPTARTKRLPCDEASRPGSMPGAARLP